MRVRYDNNNRKEVNNEITKEIDEDTSEVKSSSVVKWKENLLWVTTPKRNRNNKEVIVIPPQLKGIENLKYKYYGRDEI